MEPSKWIEWIKLPPKILFALTAFSGAIVFAPGAFLGRLGLQEFVANFRGWIGAAFLLFASLLFAHFASWTYSVIHPWIMQSVLIRRGKLRLRSLDDCEKKLLAAFINKNTRSLKLDIEDGTVHVLVREKILSQVSKIGDLIDGFAYAVQPWAWEYLQEHSEILKPYLASRPKGKHASVEDD